MTSTWIRTTIAIPIMCRVGSLCRRAKSMALFLDELLAADDADLGKAQTLSRRHDAGRNRVFRVLVRPQVNLRLDRLRRSRPDVVLERFPVGNGHTVPVHRVASVDVDLHDLGQYLGWRRIAGRQGE